MIEIKRADESLLFFYVFKKLENINIRFHFTFVVLYEYSETGI